MTALRLGVMGGTFDPIHNGHLVAASEVLSRYSLDKVVFVPTGESALKDGVTDPEHRYLMTVIATASNPNFTVSRVDIDREGATYTVDTLRDLQAEYPEAELFFITGADAISSIDSWKDSEKFWSLAKFVAVTRPEHNLVLPDAPAGAIEVCAIPALSISSTDCRKRVSAGEPVWYLVPDGVVGYISKYQLYAGAK